MTKEAKQMVIRVAQGLINTHLSNEGRAASVKIAAYLQYAEAEFPDYRKAIDVAVGECRPFLELPKLLPDFWAKLSKSQQHEFANAVRTEIRGTNQFVAGFHEAIRGQAQMIEQAENNDVLQQTALIAETQAAIPDAGTHLT